MLWSPEATYELEPFEKEAHLEEAILEVQDALFGPSRVYLDLKKKIGKKGHTRNIPDGYLLDLSSKKEPRLYLVENELARHDPLRHIAVQILQFSLSFETAQHKVKSILKEGLTANETALRRCQAYAKANGFENVDYLLERMIYGADKFNALVIIDEIPDELETVLVSRFKFPVEIITLERYCSSRGERLYRFEPFMYDLSAAATATDDAASTTVPALDPSELDTVVVPAREDGFQETFLGENRWYAIRIHSSMIPRIKYIAAYRVAPTSAITHVARVANIKQWKDTGKYVVNFAEPAEKLKAIKFVPKSSVKAPQAPRYTSLERLKSAKNLDGAF
jgi:hypothetical protein